MLHYRYRNFCIDYEIIEKINQDNRCYEATGYLEPQSRKAAPAIKFHTEFHSYQGAEEQIKKLFENFVNVSARGCALV